MFYELTFITEEKKKDTVTVDRLEGSKFLGGEKVLFCHLKPGTWAGNHIAGQNEIFATEESAIISIIENYEKGDEK